MSVSNVVYLPAVEEPRPIELEFEVPALACLVRMTPDEARHVLALISPWPIQRNLALPAGDLIVQVNLTPEGAQVWREEITLQLNELRC